ncbi:MAG: class I SAM-dependent methyltransferase [Methanogenium sp.]|jgi:predicted O-methyltransferase YrrM
MNYDECMILWKEFEGQTASEEAKELYNMVISSLKGDVVEVGSATGGTTIVLIGAAENVGKNVYSIDPYPEELENKALYYEKGLMNRMKEAFQHNILNGKYRNVIQFNKKVKDCIDKIPKGLSVVFIDGCHELTNAVDEFNLLYPLLAEGGYIYFHDTTWKEGQESFSAEGGLSNLRNKDFSKFFSEIERIGSMLRGRK